MRQWAPGNSQIEKRKILNPSYRGTIGQFNNKKCFLHSERGCDPRGPRTPWAPAPVPGVLVQRSICCLNVCMKGFARYLSSDLSVEQP